MKTKKLLKPVAIPIIIILLLITAFMTVQFFLPESVSVFSDTDNFENEIESKLDMTFVSAHTQAEGVYSTTATLKLFGFIPIKKIDVDVYAPQSLIPAGTPFGIKFFTNGVLVVGISDVETTNGIKCPAEDAGIMKGDTIVAIDGQEINTTDEFAKAVTSVGEKGLAVDLLRNGEKISTLLRPELSITANEYKVGIWVRDSTAGIGTVTFIDAQTKLFGGLGHGICDVDTKQLMPLLKGIVVDTDITEVIKSEAGTPGELRGDFGTIKKGLLTSNTETGVFGFFDTINVDSLNKPVPVGLKDEVKTGKAYIYTTTDGNSPEKYEIEISKIYKNSTNTKNFIITVTDEKLLSRTGGIVQGMSGSPIIQNGKLVGAVTHVLVDDPTRGYGIFIENMLNSANTPMAKAS